MSANILVVDNEPDMRLLFEQSFKKEIRSKAFSFHFAESGEKALALLQQHNVKFDLVLILSDIHMPGISGIELLKRIKDASTSIPVCIITSYGDTHHTQLAKEYKADEIIHKPVNFKSLKNFINGIVQPIKGYRQ